jgi:hypothetical protein
MKSKYADLLSIAPGERKRKPIADANRIRVFCATTAKRHGVELATETKGKFIYVFLRGEK